MSRTKACCPCHRTASPQTQRTAARQQANRSAALNIKKMKIEKIESINDIDSLVGLISQILGKLGLTKIERTADNILVAKEVSPLKERTTHFILTLSELNGKTPSILGFVNKIKGESDNIYVVTSNRKLSEYFKEWLLKESEFINLNFWSRKDLIGLIDDFLTEFWSHGDSFIQSYESVFIEKLENDKELKKLLKLDDKYDKLLNVFIEPKIFIFTEDKETQRPIKKKIGLENLLNNENHILSGEAGTGKSTVLKEIGKKIIENNKKSGKKSIPIIINSSTLVQNDFKLNNVLNIELENSFSEFGLDKVFEEYQIVLLVDSIDEFEEWKDAVVDTFELERNAILDDIDMDYISNKI